MAFAGLLALIAVIFLVAQLITSFNNRLGTQDRIRSVSPTSSVSQAPSTVASSTLDEQMRRAVSVRVVGKSFEKADYQTVMHDAITLKLVLKNTSNKGIKGFRGVTVFKDIFGEKILSAGFSYDEGLKAGQEKVWEGQRDYNPFMAEDRKLRDTTLENLKVEWIPRTILFADGTKLGE